MLSKFKKQPLILLTTLAVSVVLAACNTQQQIQEILVSLVADGRERTFSYTVPVTVGEFLRDAEIELGPLDRVNPPEFTQINDGMRVTVVRVEETVSCEQEQIPFRRQTIPNEGLSAGEERLGQAGQNGTVEICYRIYIEDGIEQEGVEISRTVITEPQDEVIYVGPSGELDPVAIVGTLAYISNGNAWVMRTNSTTRRPLTVRGDLDGRVFTLSPDGQRLLFTRSTTTRASDGFSNQLWLLSNTEEEFAPVELVPTDVLFADWVPGQDGTISYSTAESQPAAPGWRAFNDLWLMRIDPLSGEALDIEQVIEPSSGGLYGWWGTEYQWAPDGQLLAWARADGIGLVNLTDGQFNPLLEYPIYRTSGDWSWRATISFSPDGQRIVTTVHGPPVGSESPETSPAFNIAVTDLQGTFQADVVDSAGIWASPQYSPFVETETSEFPTGNLAYLQAREPFNSISGEYDLVVADRDNSNARIVFPKSGTGLEAQQFAWSPDGNQIALIYQGNLWIVDVRSEVARQLTLDGGASQPVWTN